MQMGDIDIFQDSLFVLRNLTGDVEVFSLRQASRDPIRRMTLRTYRRTPEPAEAASSEPPDRFGAIRSQVTIEGKSLAIALDDIGRIYVVNPLNDRHTSLHPWPGEVLTVYTHDGKHLASYRLPGVNTRDIALTRDNSILVLGHRSPNASDNSLQIFNPLYPASSQSRCEWSFR